MTTFNANEAYVWIWLPNATEPIVSGKIEFHDSQYDFFYGQSYLYCKEALALSAQNIPLLSGEIFTSPSNLHPIFCDSLPDSWGQRVLLQKYQKTLSPLDMLLLSSSDRIGALHFQKTPDNFTPQYVNHATLEQLYEASMLIEKGQPLPEDLAIAIIHGTSVGGARPKALLSDDHKKYIAKFSSSTDLYPIVQAEYAAMWLAKKVGIHVAEVSLTEVANKYVLLVERFDRVKVSNSWARKFMVSALTMLGLDEMQGRYASYLDLSQLITKMCKNPKKDQKELFRRMIFNILIGNTDDHAKNHAFFWDGINYQLAPAYDICPYLRIGLEATQAMSVGKFGSYSTLKNALSSSQTFGLSEEEAKTEIENITDGIKQSWPQACDHAKLTEQQQKQLTGTAVLNPYCFYTE